MNILETIVTLIILTIYLYCGMVGAEHVFKQYYGIEKVPTFLVVIWPFVIIGIGIRKSLGEYDE